MTDEKPGKVTTEDASAQEAIELLRKVALVLKEIGDENSNHDKDVAGYEEKIEQLEKDLENEREERASVEGLEDLLRDFRRGIVDRDELIDRTVGEYD